MSRLSVGTNSKSKNLPRPEVGPMKKKKKNA